jgi:hypothetical protein
VGLPGNPFFRWGNIKKKKSSSYILINAVYRLHTHRNAKYKLYLQYTFCNHNSKKLSSISTKFSPTVLNQTFVVTQSMWCWVIKEPHLVPFHPTVSPRGKKNYVWYSTISYNILKQNFFSVKDKDWGNTTYITYDKWPLSAVLSEIV